MDAPGRSIQGRESTKRVTSTDYGSTTALDVNPANRDAFGRQRVSTPFGLFENKNLHGKSPETMNEDTNGAGSAIIHLPNQASVQLTADTADGDYAIRQSKLYIPYLPSKSQLIAITGVMGAGKANVVQRIGYFDVRNGFFFELNNVTLNVVRRTYTSGSVVNNTTVQSSWNVDTMDGNGPSGITLDITKAQIFVIQFQWLGYGQVSWGFDINGQTHIVHRESLSNEDVVTTTQSASLPVRFEVRTSGGIAGSSTNLIETCAAVVSEGGFSPIGLEFAVSNDITPVAVATATTTFVIGIRLQDTFGSLPNKRSIQLQNAGFMSSGDHALFKIRHYHDITTLGGTWNTLNADSSALFAVDIDSITGAYHEIDAVYVPTSRTGNIIVGSANTGPRINYDKHGTISQNIAGDNSDIFAITCQSFTIATAALASMKFLEFE